MTKTKTQPSSSGGVDLRIGEVLRRLRKERGLSQTEAGKLRGTGARAISRIENGNVTVRLIEDYLDAIGATTQDFLAALVREHGSVYLGEAAPPSIVAGPDTQALADRLAKAIVGAFEEARKLGGR